jgi:hypothetical protein
MSCCSMHAIDHRNEYLLRVVHICASYPIYNGIATDTAIPMTIMVYSIVVTTARCRLPCVAITLSTNTITKNVNDVLFEARHSLEY